MKRKRHFGKKKKDEQIDYLTHTKNHTKYVMENKL